MIFQLLASSVELTSLLKFQLCPQSTFSVKRTSEWLPASRASWRTCVQKNKNLVRKADRVRKASPKPTNCSVRNEKSSHTEWFVKRGTTVYVIMNNKPRQLYIPIFVKETEVPWYTFTVFRLVSFRYVIRIRHCSRRGARKWRVHQRQRLGAPYAIETLQRRQVLEYCYSPLVKSSPWCSRVVWATSFRSRRSSFLVCVYQCSRMDYRCEDRKRVDELRGELGTIREVLTPVFR